MYGILESLRQCFKAADKASAVIYSGTTKKIELNQGAVHHLRLSTDQLKIIVTVAGGTLLFYDLKSLQDVVSDVDSNLRI